VLFQEESDLFLMQHTPPKNTPGGAGSPAISGAAPSWTQTWVCAR